MPTHSFKQSRFQIDIDLDERVGKIVVRDTYTNITFADSEYLYSAYIESGSSIEYLEGLYNPEIHEKIPERGGKIITISGHLGGMNAAVPISVRHRFYIPEDGDFFEEQIVLQNLGEKAASMRGYRFGFMKLLHKPEAYGGPGNDIEKYRMIALPFRIQPDGKKHDYQIDDIYNGRYQYSEFHNPTELADQVVDRGRARSEGWAWTDSENGLLMIKYNQSAIEYSMLGTEHREGKTYLSFGGAVPCLYSEPVETQNLMPGNPVAFGHTRFEFYEGLWARGAYMFRDYMSGLGHGLPDNYNPPVHWNELYSIGWHHNDKDALAKHYNLQTLEKEAKRAKDIGCEALYLDPGWETCEGETIWDEQRLGDAKDFVEKMKSQHGLDVAFRTIGRSYCNAYPGMYRRNANGNIGYYAPYQFKPFYEPCTCSKQYQEEKLQRIMKLADAGMSFIMFDEFDWRGPCFNKDHGHPVPTTPSMHAKAVVDLASKVHEKHLDILIEAHDPIWPWSVRYCPVYYQQNPGRTFEEVWGFEFMWNPLEDLLSGKALSLFYYNLAYDVPLYLHINLDNDNDNALAFWWYASTCRHLGIGGKLEDDKKYSTFKQAMQEYKTLKDLYTQGDFYGIDEVTHIHVLPEEGKAVVNAFNLTDTPMSREIQIRLHDLGLLEEVRIEGAQHKITGGKLVLQLDIPPFSPAVIKLVL